MSLFSIELKLSHHDRNLIERLVGAIAALKDDLVAAGAALTAAVDGLTQRIGNQAGNIGTVADADVVTSIQLQQAQAARVDALLQPPATP